MTVRTETNATRRRQKSPYLARHIVDALRPFALDLYLRTARSDNDTQRWLIAAA